MILMAFLTSLLPIAVMLDFICDAEADPNPEFDTRALEVSGHLSALKRSGRNVYGGFIQPCTDHLRSLGADPVP